MKVEVDTSRVEKAVAASLAAGGDGVFLGGFSLSELDDEAGITCGSVLKELEAQSGFARQIVRSVVESSLRMWILRLPPQAEGE